MTYSLEKLSDNWTDLTSAEKRALFEATGYEKASAEDLAALGTFKVLIYAEADQQANLSLTAVPHDQLVLPRTLISLDSFDGIDKVMLAKELSGNGICKLLVTSDMETYQTYDFDTEAWKKIDHANIAAIKLDGIDADRFVNITRSAWDKLLKGKVGLGIAYLMGIERTTDTCMVDQLEAQVDMRGAWRKLI